jgi:hypothetical protein
LFKPRSNSYAGALHPEDRRLCDDDHADADFTGARRRNGDRLVSVLTLFSLVHYTQLN